MIDDASDVPWKSKVILASFTTAKACVILQNYLLKVKNPSNTLYCDTDSIMYIQKPLEFSENPLFQTGSHRGEMTNGLAHDVDVDSFYRVGTKVYIISGKKLSDGRNFIFFKLKAISMKGSEIF